MRLEISKVGLKIIPENEEDEVYLEHYLGLKKDGDRAPLIRENAWGLSCMGHCLVRPGSGHEKNDGE